MYFRSQVLLFICLVSLTFLSKRSEGAKRGCGKLLQEIRKNPPNSNTMITIDIRRSEARYRCRDGFKLVGQKIRRCKNGKWTKKQEPKCLGPCGRPANIPHAEFHGRNFDHKGKLTYSCKKGYKLRGPSRRTCREDGKWSKPPSCSPLSRCRNPGNITIPNGNVMTTDPQYRYGAELVFECNEGFHLKGKDTITCKEFGWESQKLPYCKEKQCSDPGRPKNGDRLGRFKVGSTVRFSCQYGFVLHGSRERTCMESLEWSGSLTTCQDGSTDCPILGTPINGRKYGSKYNHGNIVTFDCNHGFVLKGSAVRRCLENGTWNGTEVICRDKLQVEFKDVDETAKILRKNIINTILGYDCGRGNENGCNKTNAQNMDTRGRALIQNSVKELDLVFVLDASSSVKREGFQIGLGFVKKLVRKIGAGKRENSTRIALVTFGTTAKLEFNLGDAKVDTVKKAIKVISAVKYTKGATASTLALQMARKDVASLARANSERVMIFITDGKSNIGEPPKREAFRLKNESRFEIYAVGVGEDTNRYELMDIASANEDDDHVIMVRTYGDLKRAIKKAVTFKKDYSICGKSPFHYRDTIVGGKDAKHGWWPWQIGLYIPRKGDSLLKCGGALISSQWVLTAAHCFPSNDNQENVQIKYRIKAGDYHLDENEDSEQEVPIEKIFVHHGYRKATFESDIALVKLKQPVELGDFVRTVCLPKSEEGDLATPTKYGFASGWGSTKPSEGERNSDHSKVLKYSPFEIQQDRLCLNATKKIVKLKVTFCAGDGKGGNDTCFGDSGGAFVREVKRGNGHRWVATGLISWGEGCAQKNHYGYYTRVYPFIDWINNTVHEN